jgi:hypothetical protein
MLPGMHFNALWQALSSGQVTFSPIEEMLCMVVIT